MKRNKWTLEKCLKIAKKYKTIKEWRQGHFNSYCAAQYHKWHSKCTAHMTRLRSLPFRFLSASKVASQYPTRTQWFKNNPASYAFARRNKIIDKCFKNGNKLNQPRAVMCVETGRIYPGVRAAVRSTGLKGIPMVLTGKSSNANGYTFIYLD